MKNHYHSAEAQILTAISTKDLDDVLLSGTHHRSAKDVEFVAKMILHAGIRPGELRSLAWSDVDLANRFMRVHSSKSGQIRRVPFGGLVLDLLLDRATTTQDSTHVLGRFPSTALQRALRSLQRIWRGAKPTQVTFMSLRRSFAHRWMNAGGSAVALFLAMEYATPATMKTLHSDCSLYEAAARFQRQLEDQS